MVPRAADACWSALGSKDVLDVFGVRLATSEAAVGRRRYPHRSLPDLILLISSMTSQVTADPITASSPGCISLPSSETQSGSLHNCRQTFRQNATHRSWHTCFWNTQKLSADTQITPRTEVLEKLIVALPVIQFARLICIPKVYYCLHQSPPLFPILNHTNSVYAPNSYFKFILILSSNLRLGLTSDIFPSVFWLNISQTLVRATCAAHFSPLHMIAITVVCIWWSASVDCLRKVWRHLHLTNCTAGGSYEQVT